MEEFWRNNGTSTTCAFPNTSDVAKSFGVKPLQPEKAINVGAGFTSTLSSHISMAVDGYWIQIKNRIVLSGTFDKANNAEVARVLRNHPDIDQVQFITNAINTRNLGLDIVLNGHWKIKKANLRVIAAANFNRTKLFGAIQNADSLSGNSQNANTLLNREERIKIEKGQPASKIILTGSYTIGKIAVLIRSARFGKSSYAFGVHNETLDEFYSAKILTDASFSYSPKTWFTITAGANNIFDVYPDRNKNPLNTNQGILIYSNESSSFGYNCGYYYLNMSFRF